MKLYDLDIEQFILDIIPPPLRTPKRVAWLESLLNPSETLQSYFIQFGTQKLYEINFTGQVISIERRLNDEFDPTLRRIYLSDNVYVDEIFAFYDGTTNSSNETQFAFYDGTTNSSEEGFWLYQDNYVGDSDFTVNVPIGLVYDSARLSALVNRYKIAGKRFIIQEI